jgi:hypothetical protein
MRNLAREDKTRLVGDRPRSRPLPSWQIPSRDWGGRPRASVGWLEAEPQFALDSANAPGNAVGSNLENLPWPSLRSIATGR